MTRLFPLALVVQIAFSQAVFQSPYLQTPEKMFGFVDSCARFWMNAHDPVNGGYFVNINRQGAPFGTLLKNTLSQSRNAYGFVRAFQMTGDTLFLRYARHGLDFMYAHSWDQSNGGWYNELGVIGTPVNAGANKTAFYQHYALLGIIASFEATNDSTDREWLMKGVEYNEEKLWDDDIANFGYYDFVSANGSNPTDKSFNATVDAVTTHMLHLYLLTGEEKYHLRLRELADNMIYRLASTAASQQIGFAERYNSSWQIKSGNSDETRTIMGHVLKTAWCLARIYQIEKDSTYLAVAEKLVQNVLDKGYDHQNGGPYKDYNRITGQMLMYGISDTAKAWWQMEQAVTAGLMLYQLTGKEKYLTMADGSLDFFMKYFVDHTYGDVFENTNKYGGMIPQWGTTKGGAGKAGYHSIETGYYTYLYGNLLVRKQPATLHYRFAPAGTDRQIAMKPIGLPEGDLKILSVQRNGVPYTQYDSTALVLTLSAGTGGIFAVTYAPTKAPLHIVQYNNTPSEFVLHQNYPNPFNPSTTIEFTLASAGMTTVNVFDGIGRHVGTLVNEVLEGGKSYRVTFDGAELSSGIYFIRLQHAGGVRTRRMMLMK